MAERERERWRRCDVNGLDSRSFVAIAQGLYVSASGNILCVSIRTVFNEASESEQAFHSTCRASGCWLASSSGGQAGSLLQPTVGSCVCMDVCVFGLPRLLLFWSSSFDESAVGFFLLLFFPLQSIGKYFLHNYRIRVLCIIYLQLCVIT